MRPTLINAVVSLVPGAEITCYKGTITWHKPSEPPVTDEQIQAELVRLQQEYDYEEYRRLRAAEYPPIGDQLDALFHAGVFPSGMAAQLQAVKDRYPKP